MKMLLTALALTIASPVAAQTAHSGHSAHAARQDSSHAAQHAAPSGDPHAQHKTDGKCCDKMADGKMMGCCEKMKAEGKKPCCDHKQGKSEAAEHKGHGNH